VCVSELAWAPTPDERGAVGAAARVSSGSAHAPRGAACARPT
jgi:hypothetical protein